MKTYNNPPKNEWESLLKRPQLNQENLDVLINQVFNKVRENGDEALKNYTLKFDKAIAKQSSIKLKHLNTDEIELSPVLKKVIAFAAENIYIFHKAQKNDQQVKVETQPGVLCWQENRAIENVGIYIPGGSAPLFSTVLMLAIPAKIAGCKKVVLCTPPQPDGNVHPAILYAAKLTGVDMVYPVGGAQAIAALTVGTESISKVNKIFGPGNQYVTAAKQYAQRLGVAIDMPAGPSELLVMADESCNPKYVAADLLSQAEHGADSQVILVADSLDIVNRVQAEIEGQLNILPRKTWIEKALNTSRAIVFPNLADRLSFVNAYAPEHLIIVEKQQVKILEKINNAGSVFLGNYTPESAGDYASGTNHTLPTNGAAKQYSGVNVDAYLKKITVQQITEKGLASLAESIEVMAENEGLMAHKNAVSIRLKMESDELE